MRRGLMIAAVAVLAACGADSDPIDIGTGTNGSIRGTVTDNTGAAVANAEVELTGNAQAARTTNSAANGVYNFADVPPGTYTVEVTPPAGFTLGVAGTTQVTVASAVRADAASIVLTRVAASDSCTVSLASLRPDFGGMASEAERQLFAYDASAPLNLQKGVASTVNGVEVSPISYTSPDGGSVPGILFEPVNRSGPRPGIVLMHGLPGNAGDVAGYAHALSQYGAVVIAITAPFSRRSGNAVRFIDADRAEQIQLIKDLQRAVDVLRAHPDVADDRIAYVGISYGAAMGALFVGIERRLNTAVLVVGDGGLVSHYTGSEDLNFMRDMSCEKRLAWFDAMVPIEPIRFIGHASPTPLLLQNGRIDSLVPRTDGELLQAAAPEPKTLLWYEAGHGLNQQALFDRHDWLSENIGLDPLQ